MDEAIQLSGQTAPFSGHGRGLGYPTANIHTQNKLKEGVYLGRASLAEFTNHPALVFVGIPTTVGDRDWRVEAHLLDIPDQDYYGLQLQLELLSFLRPNQTFVSVEDLRRQMKDDEAKARAFFASEAKHV